MLTIIVPVIDLDTSCGKVQSFYLYSKLGRTLTLHCSFFQS